MVPDVRAVFFHDEEVVENAGGRTPGTRHTFGGPGSLSLQHVTQSVRCSVFCTSTLRPLPGSVDNRVSFAHTHLRYGAGRPPGPPRTREDSPPQDVFVRCAMKFSSKLVVTLPVPEKPQVQRRKRPASRPGPDPQGVARAWGLRAYPG